mmetsp:Transcript_3108/g.5494  ORF Transcript_3108/g.5494 Transcript_3108/m.5494 type:complete len:266 (+) Transcript_3108:209-1006(+)
MLTGSRRQEEKREASPAPQAPPLKEFRCRPTLLLGGMPLKSDEFPHCDFWSRPPCEAFMATSRPRPAPASAAAPAAANVARNSASFSRRRPHSCLYSCLNSKGGRAGFAVVSAAAPATPVAAVSVASSVGLPNSPKVARAVVAPVSGAKPLPSDTPRARGGGVPGASGVQSRSPLDRSCSVKAPLKRSSSAEAARVDCRRKSAGACSRARSRSRRHSASEALALPRSLQLLARPPPLVSVCSDAPVVSAEAAGTVGITIGLRGVS